MLILAAALIAAPLTSVHQAQPTSCPITTSYLTGAGGLYRGKPLAPHRLTELPDGNFYLTVYRRIDGCEVPIVVKYGVNRR
jgi:hypothetical protein